MSSPVADIQKILKKKDTGSAFHKKWVRKMEFLRNSVADDAVIILHDTLANQFVYMSDPAKVLGNYDMADFTSETGMDFNLNNVHPEQRGAALLIQLKILSFGIEHPGMHGSVAHIMFAYKKKGAGYIQFLQRLIVAEADAAGHPRLYLRYGYNISHLVKPCVGLLIHTADETLIWHYNMSKKCLEQINLLSAQEKKILSLLADGMSSKTIAAILFISHHTIDTHRRNLLKKTNCIDTTALITFAKMTGLI